MSGVTITASDRAKLSAAVTKLLVDGRTGRVPLPDAIIDQVLIPALDLIGADRQYVPFGFVLRVSEDSAKLDLELIHEACGQLVCDAEARDTLDLLARCALGHTCGVS